MNSLSYTILFLVSITAPLIAQQRAHVHTISKEQPINYLLYLPQEYTDSGEQVFPLLLFLHGGGEGGDDVEKVKTHGPPMLVEQGQDFPFIILSPQNPYQRKFWDTKAIYALLEEIMQEYRVDSSRIYLSGLSRGGYGAWTLAMEYPERFAALAPVCGAVPSSYAGWVPEIPIWVFHGADDPVINLEESVDMVNALKRLDHQVKLTVYENTGHNSWVQAYNDPELYRWLMKQQRSIKP